MAFLPCLRIKYLIYITPTRSVARVFPDDLLFPAGTINNLGVQSLGKTSLLPNAIVQGCNNLSKVALQAGNANQRHVLACR